MAEIRPSGSSFRDPNGFIFVAGGEVFRQVNKRYQRHYDCLIESGLYAALVERQMLISHSDQSLQFQLGDDAYKALRPQQLPFVSYPYEWSFSQLKDAALLTLAIQKRALAQGMILKDASAYNIQFLAGKPILIDTLSFEIYEAGKPWIAYRQFCQHFLAPLVLMSRQDVRLGQLLRTYLDGIPLDLASDLSPKRSYLNIGIAMHLHLHARAQKRYAGRSSAAQMGERKRLGKRDIVRICDNLKSTVAGLNWTGSATAWADYYDGDSYDEEGFDHKRQLVEAFIGRARPECVWDLGANTGEFSRIASRQGIFALSIDSDPGAVEANYLEARRAGDGHLHPLLIDLTNPSGASGWANRERDSLTARGQADCVLALALIHHIAIGNNVPLARIAEYFASLAEWLIVEFVPKQDKKAQTLLAAREDIFDAYNEAEFERSFGAVFEIVDSRRIERSERKLYLMRRKTIAAE